jgi:DNA-binding transcriptional MerR regulator
VRDLISIGKLAQASGFDVPRLRIWELRYGRPIPIRRPSGHRRYSVTEVDRLDLVRQALAQDLRPRHVAGLSLTSLQQVVSALQPTARPAEPVALMGLEKVRDLLQECKECNVGADYITDRINEALGILDLAPKTPAAELDAALKVISDHGYYIVARGIRAAIEREKARA